MNINGFNIGQEVNYLRFESGEGVISGSGQISAVFLEEASGRVMARIVDAEGSVYNIDFATVNCTDAVKDKYADMMKKTEKLTKEGNELVKKTVEKYNKMVEDTASKVFGEPITLKKAIKGDIEKV